MKKYKIKQLLIINKIGKKNNNSLVILEPLKKQIVVKDEFDIIRKILNTNLPIWWSKPNYFNIFPIGLSLTTKPTWISTILNDFLINEKLKLKYNEKKNI